MNDNFATCLALVLKSEGGISNHPADKGGLTNKGVTQAVYDAYRRRKGLSLRSVAMIEDQEVGDIYRCQYWDASGCDRLPIGVDYAVFDYAVNSGVSRSVKALQRVVGVAADGVFGIMTDAAVDRLPAKDIINRLCDTRLSFLQSLTSLFRTFGRGWTRRVSEVRATALAMRP